MLDEVVLQRSKSIQRTQVQEALKDAEKRYRELFDTALDAIFIRDLNGNIVEVNRAAAMVTGYTVDELAKMNISELISAESFQMIIEKQKALLGSKVTSQRYLIEIARKDGTRRIVDAVTSLLTSHDQPVGIHAVVRDVTEHVRLRDNMRFYISEVLRAQEEERKRIARDLHDETAQYLAALCLDIEAITRTKSGLSNKKLQRLRELRDKVDSILEGVRRFCHELRPEVLDQLGLIPALELLTDELNTKNISAHVEVVGRERRLSSEKELVLFRIAQEALSNVRRHSSATEVTIIVKFTPKKVRLDIADNGRGFELPEVLSDFATKGKLGLIGMSERARLLNGNVSIKSRTSKGTIVTVDIKSS